MEVPQQLGAIMALFILIIAATTTTTTTITSLFPLLKGPYWSPIRVAAEKPCFILLFLSFFLSFFSFFLSILPSFFPSSALSFVRAFSGSVGLFFFTFSFFPSFQNS